MAGSDVVEEFGALVGTQQIHTARKQDQHVLTSQPGPFLVVEAYERTELVDWLALTGAAATGLGALSPIQNPGFLRRMPTCK